MSSFASLNGQGSRKTYSQAQRAYMVSYTNKEDQDKDETEQEEEEHQNLITTVRKGASKAPSTSFYDDRLF